MLFPLLCIVLSRPTLYLTRQYKPFFFKEGSSRSRGLCCTDMGQPRLILNSDHTLVKVCRAGHYHTNLSLQFAFVVLFPHVCALCAHLRYLYILTSFPIYTYIVPSIFFSPPHIFTYYPACHADCRGVCARHLHC